MSFKKTFCPSPWFHMRINNSGTYEYCRWMSHPAGSRVDANLNISKLTPAEYFKHTISPIRQDLLNGAEVPGCSDCKRMEQHGKVSGRQRQLLKVGVVDSRFTESLASSTFRPAFDYSAANNGDTTTFPQDWQIDLGNYCNSQCVMCNPESSSKIATEFKQLKLITQLPPTAWCNDPVLVERFCDSLRQAPNIKYLHFIGGETLITPGFKRILKAVIDTGLASTTTVGFTTNLTIWDESIIELLTQFENVNLGLSIEALDSVNDYVRYPSELSTTRKLLDQWVALGKTLNWLIQLRITPTCLTVNKLSTIYEYAYANRLAVESCNFLESPECLRISVLPQEYRQQAIDNLTQWLGDKQSSYQQIINTRDPSLAQDQIIQDANSYLNYLTNSPDESNKLPDLVKYLELLESSRGNSILTYLPEYEKLLRANGYAIRT